MISHSLVQGGPGFPYLSPSIYWYLATGDQQTALAKASCADVQNNDLIKYIDKTSDASDSDLAAVTFESEFIQLMCEAGETRVLTADNKLDVLQSLMLHDILVKRKSILDQLRKVFLSLSLEHLKFQCPPCHIAYQYLAIMVIPFLPQHVYLN
ncbi:uncharacterized protein [Montipora foliosa]|uniref:uncharacterized protein n=1 Tax=Montipora foliosa TaxID=591990 RepID=UPI0035F1BA51